MRRILIVLAVLSFLGMGGTAAMAGCCCCKPPKLEKMTKPPCQCCCCKKHPQKVGESYMGKGNGADASPCCEPPREHHLFHKICK